MEHTNVWDMYCFHKKYNSNDSIIFRDKTKFRKKFNSYFNYPYFVLKNRRDINVLINWIEDQSLEVLVAKTPLGAVGKGVRVLKVKRKGKNTFINNKPVKKFITSLFGKGYILFESGIQQHPTLSEINPDSVNTIRVITFVSKKEIEIWGALVRMGYDKSIDNFDAGGLSAKIETNSGVISEPAKIKDPFVTDTFVKHPKTGSQILSVKIPYWDEVIALVKNAAMEVDGVRTVGWDVAITPGGPTLVEGNDNWDKTLFELIIGIGLNKRIKRLLEQ
jgi:hypothetical protein